MSQSRKSSNSNNSGGKPQPVSKKKVGSSSQSADNCPSAMSARDVGMSGDLEDGVFDGRLDQKVACGDCGSAVIDDSCIQCGSCCKWFHLDCCIDLVSEDIHTLSKSGVHWYCRGCDGIFKSIDDKFSKIESAIKCFSENNQLTKAIDKAIESKLSKHSYSSVVKGLEDTSKALQSKIENFDKYDNYLKSLETTSSVMQKVADDNEKKEERVMQDFRDKNIIVFGLPDDNKKESTLQLVNELLKECNIAPITDSNKCYRLGKKSSDSTKVRPIRICTDLKDKKWDIMKRINALKRPGVFARRDLNKEEREKDFQLRKQLKQMREENKGKFFKIKKGQIVEMTSKSE